MEARDDADAYRRYLAGMDASMRQKVALTAAHLLAVGDLADMGMGSGSGSHALAALYPGLSVVGVDLDPGMVARAAERYRLPNLRFVQGDVAAPVFPEGTLEGILDSSVLHHVTSFGGYDRDAARRALAVQARQLAPGGVLVLRDFLDPGPGVVELSVRDDDGEGEAPATCSTACLLERFAMEFRSLSESPGFPLEPLGADGPGWRRYRLDRTHAVEFLLRKDYRRDWEAEVREEYTFATQETLEAWFVSLGLRLLSSTPIRNPWIVNNRFVGHARWTEPDWPATNVVVVGQRVRPGEGVVLRAESDAPVSGYLERSRWRHLDSGVEHDVVRRPGATLDVVPWFESGGAVHVVARRSYPRPILGDADAALDGRRPSTWVTEPLCVQQADRPAAQTAEELLAGFGRIGDTLLAVEEGGRWFPSPGGLQEEVRSLRVHIEPVAVDVPLVVENGFTTAGTLRSLAAEQVLRAAQVGGLPDARLELAVYDLLAALGQSPGPWIGETLRLGEGSAPQVGSLERPRRRRWLRAGGESSFLLHRARRYVEHDASGEQVGERVLESVIPATRSTNTVAVAPLRRAGGRVWIGLEDDDLPVAQCFTGSSATWVVPAWRLPRDVTGLEDSRAWIRARLEERHGLVIDGAWELGGPFAPSAGVTPELVWPLAIGVADEGSGAVPLVWIPLEEAVASTHLVDGHTRVVTRRAAHALGLLSRAAQTA